MNGPRCTCEQCTAEAPVRITSDGIYFGDVKLPGVVAEGSVAVIPGGADDFNRLRVEFIVGEVITDDPTR